MDGENGGKSGREGESERKEQKQTAKRWATHFSLDHENALARFPRLALPKLSRPLLLFSSMHIPPAYVQVLASDSRVNGFKLSQLQDLTSPQHL